jgi:hypothetical protein
VTLRVEPSGAAPVSDGKADEVEGEVGADDLPHAIAVANAAATVHRRTLRAIQMLRKIG